MANRSSVSALVERSPRASIRGRNVAVGSRVSTRTREAERSELVRWAILVGAGVFATTFAQPAVLKLPLQYLLKSDLHVSRDAMAAFFAAGALAWYFKPLAGILSDSVPLFGTRRRHYLLLRGGVDAREGRAPHAHALGHALERGRAALPGLHRPGVPDAPLLLPDRHPGAVPRVHRHAELLQRGVRAGRRVSLRRPLPAAAAPMAAGARHCAQRARHARLPLLSLRHGGGADRGRERSPRHARGAGADGPRGTGDAARERRARLRADDERAQCCPRGFGHLRLVADRAAPGELLQPGVAQRGHDGAGPTRGAVPAAGVD